MITPYPTILNCNTKIVTLAMFGIKELECKGVYKTTLVKVI